MQLVARNRKSRAEVEFPRSVQLVARNRQSRTEVEFPCSVQLVARKNTLKNHRTSFRTEVKSVVHQDARYTQNGKQRANFK